MFYIFWPFIFSGNVIKIYEVYLLNCIGNWWSPPGLSIHRWWVIVDRDVWWQGQDVMFLPEWSDLHKGWNSFAFVPRPQPDPAPLSLHREERWNSVCSFLSRVLKLSARLLCLHMAWRPSPERHVRGPPQRSRETMSPFRENPQKGLGQIPNSPESCHCLTLQIMFSSIEVTMRGSSQKSIYNPIYVHPLDEMWLCNYQLMCLPPY